MNYRLRERERGGREVCVLSQHLFNLATPVIRETYNELLGIKTGGKLISNLRYADDIALCGE